MNRDQLLRKLRDLPSHQREDFLEKRCGKDQQLRAWLLKQLELDNDQYDATEEFCSPKPNESDESCHATTFDSDPESSDNDFDLRTQSYSNSAAKRELQNSTSSTNDSTSIGPYKILEVLGEGGMGTVFLAEQKQPVSRRVALKVIKTAVGSKEVLARFEVERQAMAMMNHPNIARILDAGTTHEGQPFFAMELVHGSPITEYCDQNRLSVDDRLKLFCDICDGVQHAHQKGIIHRDLKPSNILVTVVDGKPVAKIIDFGLAKATEASQRLTDQSLFTGIGQVLGTLKYMSPEQAALDTIDIDTRTDIYALGIILYELLTGQTPIDSTTIKDQAILKVLELIRERDPEKPSSRLSHSDAASLSSLTQLRRTDLKKIRRELTGDLDWIVMKALEKDRTRRYDSASGFANDIQRYLTSEPVEARPPSMGYRVHKFVRKNRAGVIAASLLLAFLVAGIVGTSWGMFLAEESAARERVARKAAEDAMQEAITAKNAEGVAKENALERLKQIERSNELLGSIFDDFDIDEVRKGADPVEAVLATRLISVAKQLNIDTIRDPFVLANLQHRLGNSLLALGFPDDAINLFEKSLPTRKKHLPADHPDVLACMNDL